MAALHLRCGTVYEGSPPGILLEAILQVHSVALRAVADCYTMAPAPLVPPQTSPITKHHLPMCACPPDQATAPHHRASPPNPGHAPRVQQTRACPAGPPYKQLEATASAARTSQPCPAAARKTTHKPSTALQPRSAAADAPATLRARAETARAALARPLTRDMSAMTDRAVRCPDGKG